MVRFRSLQSRITTLSTLAFGVVLVLVAVSMQWAISASAEKKVREELSSSAKVVDRIWSMRSQELDSVARPLALDFGFREAVATDDDATIRSALANIAGRIDLPNAFVVKYDGRVVGLRPSEDEQYDSALWEELDSGWHSGALRIDERTFQAVAAEIKAPALIGWLVIGRRLDESETRELSALSAIPVRASIVRRGEDGTWIFDSSNEPVADKGVTQLLSRMLSEQAPRAFSDSMDGKMVLVRPLGESNGVATTALVLDFSIADALAEYNSLRLAVLGAGLLGLILLGFASTRLSRHIVRPITALEDAAKRLEQGEQTRLAVTSDDEIGHLTASFNAMSEEILQRENRIRHMAFHDALTDLPNKVQLGERLDEMLTAITRDGGTLAVLCIDLDNFKMVNDTLGHQVGDQLLKSVARKLVDVTKGCFVARSGGDEFWVLVDGEKARDVAVDLAHELLEKLKEPITIEGHVMRPGASLGMSFAPEDSMRPDDLIKHADLALHKAKEAGRGRVVHFTADLDKKAQARREMETDLHAALANGEFELYFQPLFDLQKNRFCAFEALIRWNHPSRGQVSPVEFIPVAEESGMIVPIGEWVLKEACRNAVTWPEDIKVAVNFSTVQFNSPGLTNLVFQTLASSGLAPRRLEVEITESLFLESSESILATLNALKTIGVRIALDDFGTGFSSLSYLRKYPFDKIKIDRSFIIELLEKDEAGAVVKAITDLAAALNMETTAEGVEEDDQVEALRAHGCTNVQGYLFSKPVPAHMVLPLLGVDLSRHVA